MKSKTESPTEILAFVNLNKLSVGTHTVLVATRFAKGEVVHVTPPATSLFIDVKKDKIVPVTAEIIGSPNKDFAVASQMLTPSEVKVEGAATRLDALDKIFVPVDVSSRSEDFTVTQKPLALAKDGMDMQDVVIDPAEILVRTKLKERIQTVTVPVKVSFKGNLPENLKMTSSTANPFKVTVSGPPSVIDGLKELELEPVDLGKVSKDSIIQAGIVFPDKFPAALLFQFNAGNYTTPVGIEGNFVQVIFNRAGISVLRFRSSSPFAEAYPVSCESERRHPGQEGKLAVGRIEFTFNGFSVRSFKDGFLPFRTSGQTGLHHFFPWIRQGVEYHHCS